MHQYLTSARLYYEYLCIWKAYKLENISAYTIY